MNYFTTHIQWTFHCAVLKIWKKMLRMSNKQLWRRKELNLRTMLPLGIFIMAIQTSSNKSNTFVEICLKMNLRF